MRYLAESATKGYMVCQWRADLWYEENIRFELRLCVLLHLVQSSKWGNPCLCWTWTEGDLIEEVEMHKIGRWVVQFQNSI